ncbi:O-antigen ligase family protein [Patescibacteria group bacterium]|nr:O-antigen ligase family protein [Patescibacteria group bacterium]
MLFLVFLSFTFFIRERAKNKKIIYAVLFSLFIFTVLITSSRATYLGLLIGFFYFFFFYPKKFKTLKIIAASLVLIAIIIAIFFNLFPQVAEKNKLLEIAVNRLSIKKVAKDLAGTRFSAWKITLKTIEEKPIFGWGPENSYIGFDKYYDPTDSNIKNMWWDRPHNILLDIAASSGIISLVLYLLFWLLLFWQLQRFKRQQGENEYTYLAHGLQTMFIGYLVVLFFNFDNFATYLISFFFIGYAFYLISMQSEKKLIYPPRTNAVKNKLIYIPILIVLICFIWFWNIKPLYLNEEISYVQVLTDVKKCEKSLSTMDKVWQNGGILKSYSGLKYADFIKRCASSNPEKEVDYSKKASEVLKISSKIQPKFTRTWIFLGSFTNVLAAREENIENRNKLLLEARSYLEKALELSPKRQEIFIEIEKGYIIAEDYQTMKKIAYDCIDIDSSYGQCYWYLGIAEIFLGDQENGKKHIQESLERGSSPSYIQLGVAYISQNNYKDAADAYHMLTAIYPENANYHAAMAFLSREIGDYSRARRETLEVFRLQPENKEVLIFLERLLGLSPNDPALHFSLAYIYARIGETEKANQEYLIVKSLYLQAVAKYPEDPDYHFSLAGVYKELGEYEKAYQEALIAEKIDPGRFHNVVMDLISSLHGDYWEKYLRGEN